MTSKSSGSLKNHKSFANFHSKDIPIWQVHVRQLYGHRPPLPFAGADRVTNGICQRVVLSSRG